MRLQRETRGRKRPSRVSAHSVWRAQPPFSRLAQVCALAERGVPAPSGCCQQVGITPNRGNGKPLPFWVSTAIASTALSRPLGCPKAVAAASGSFGRQAPETALGRLGAACPHRGHLPQPRKRVCVICPRWGRTAFCVSVRTNKRKSAASRCFPFVCAIGLGFANLRAHTLQYQPLYEGTNILLLLDYPHSLVSNPTENNVTTAISLTS